MESNLRIIAGKYKGHHLVSFQADHIRPTTDRVKETLFNKIQFLIEGQRVLDLFSGTGNLGLEAYSRGAGFIHFVDKHPKSLEILLRNIDKLKVPKADFKTTKMDILAFLSKRSRPSKEIVEGDENYDLIFIDPPFTEKMAHAVMEGLGKSSLFHASTLITIESIKKERIDDEYGPLVRYDYKDFGDKVLSFFKMKSAEGESGNEK